MCSCSMQTAIYNMQITEHVCVQYNLFTKQKQKNTQKTKNQKQAASWIWPMSHSLPTPDLDYES